MKTVVVGAGYVGLVTAVTLAVLEHEVTCVDIDEAKIANLTAGRPTFYEQGLEQALKTQVDSGRLAFDTDIQRVMPGAEFVFLCVGTPSSADGAPDLSQVMGAARQIASGVTDPIILVIKSTVPVGTNRRLTQFFSESARALHPNGTESGSQVTVVSSPEFLREGTALSDSLSPDRIVIGAADAKVAYRVKALYEKLEAPVLTVTPEEAELIKYASNTFLALKISFANNLADFCDEWNADVREVTKGMGLDPRIGPQFLQAGLGFGGSCFPKDVRAMLYQAGQLGLPTGLYDETLKINQERISRIVDKLYDALGTLDGRSIAVLGLSFKPGTDDTRESPSLSLVKALLAQGCLVRAYDPQAMANAQSQFPKVSYFASEAEATVDADAVILATDWSQFVELPWRTILESMHIPLVVDARNQLDGRKMVGLGAHYVGMGVPSRG